MDTEPFSEDLILEKRLEKYGEKQCRGRERSTDFEARVCLMFHLSIVIKTTNKSEYLN